MLHELIYTSLAIRPMTSADLTKLLAQSREKNLRLNVTGILVYYEREFMQVLEGEKDAIFSLYETIVLDERHTSVRLMYDGPIAQRNFRRWSMAFYELTAAEAQGLCGWSSFLDNGLTGEVLRNDPSVAQRLLLSVRDQMLE